MASETKESVEALQRQVEELTAKLKDAEDTLQGKRSIVRSRSVVDRKAFEKDMSSLNDKALTVIVIGASGHLARTKTYPALFALHHHMLLPKHANVVGLARRDMEPDAFQKQVGERIKGSKEERDDFLNRCSYFKGDYGSEKDFADLHKYLCEVEKKSGYDEANRLWYYAIPPSVFADTARSMSASSMTQTGWNRIIVEKPFGKDSESSAELANQLLSRFQESQLYRIDHYLGKELVQNLMTLRFANTVFEPLWNRHHVSSVTITFKEQDGVEGRGGYFDEFGIIRDVVQNHLLQIMSLVAMEQPVSLSSEDVRDAKVRVLRCVRPLTLDDVVVGQYSANETAVGYTEDPSVPDDSITPTFALCVFEIDSPRWSGVPFILKAGKGLNERKAEIRVQFKEPPGSVYKDVPNNELVLRVQPDEAVYLKLMSKQPGLSSSLEQAELDLSFGSRFNVSDLPDAYETLVLDVLRGDSSKFVRSDELKYAWEIFTPLLHALDEQHIKPVKYKKGTRAPEEADALAAKHGVKHHKGYNWPGTSNL